MAKAKNNGNNGSKVITTVEQFKALTDEQRKSGEYTFAGDALAFLLNAGSTRLAASDKRKKTVEERRATAKKEEEKWAKHFDSLKPRMSIRFRRFLDKDGDNGAEVTGVVVGKQKNETVIYADDEKKIEKERFFRNYAVRVLCEDGEDVAFDDLTDIIATGPVVDLPKKIDKKWVAPKD